MATKPDIDVKEFRKMKLTYDLKSGEKHMMMGSNIEIEDLERNVDRCQIYD